MTLKGLTINFRFALKNVSSQVWMNVENSWQKTVCNPLNLWDFCLMWNCAMCFNLCKFVPQKCFAAELWPDPEPCSHQCSEPKCSYSKLEDTGTQEFVCFPAVLTIHVSWLKNWCTLDACTISGHTRTHLKYPDHSSVKTCKKHN